MVRPDDPEAYADAIGHLLDNPELGSEMGQEGRHRVELEYNWESQAVKLVKLYQGLL